MRLMTDAGAEVGSIAEACFRLGVPADQTRIINFHAECSGSPPGIRIDLSSRNTTIINLFPTIVGAPIRDIREVWVGRRPVGIEVAG